MSPTFVNGNLVNVAPEFTAHIQALDEARRSIAAQAGLPGKYSASLAVFWSEFENEPPRIKRTKRRGQVRERHVTVGERWLRTHRPKVWRVFVAARLAGLHQSLLPTSYINRKGAEPNGQ